MELKKSKTYENLAKAFAGESQANIRYKFIGYGARQQGYTALSDLIDRITTQEFHHARMFYTKLQDGNNELIENIDISSGYPFKEKWDLCENLAFAANDEKNEASRTYPIYAETARKEGFEDIANLFEYVTNVERCHRAIFDDLYNQMKNNTMYSKDVPTRWVCKDCGHSETKNKAWKCCPLCGAKQGAVEIHLSENVQCE